MKTVTSPVRKNRRLQCQTGAATLVVVMVLFFLMLLVSAYAGRTLIFEQRTSANQYRATQAYEAAQGGLEWALAMLNSDERIGTDCQPTVDVTMSTFRGRYLTTDLAAERVLPSSNANAKFAACMRTDSGWKCHCPQTGVPQLIAEATSTTAFKVSFKNVLITDAPEPLEVQVEACSSANDVQCYANGTGADDAKARQKMKVALIPVLRQIPTAALTVYEYLLPGPTQIPADIKLVNRFPGSNGLTLSSYNPVDIKDLRSLITPPGTPAQDSWQGQDPALIALNGVTNFFPSLVGFSRTVYQTLPNVASPACPSGSCSPSIQNLAQQGRRLFYVAGPLALPSGTKLGSDSDPVVLVVDGPLQLQSSTQITGLVFTQGLSWQGATVDDWIKGATLVQGPCCVDVQGTASLIYDRDVMRRLQLAAGAYARVPGSWIDR